MLVLAMVSTVLLLICMGFFMMGSLPLLILKHDTPLDAGFIRGLFNVYYRALMIIATVGAVSFAFTGRIAIAVVVGCMAGLGYAGHRWVVGRMDAVRSTMTPEDRAAIRQFRKLHIGGMLVNVVLLAGFVVGMTKVHL